ncbi:WXG100 family type VII secretion target [Nocardia sp. NPDC050378]|uniref:WXG100 family type VII secretion target n=1 Tax=Nocardia sp. NPDC050378 TaxID=3155400 RepID=UPI0034065876
MSILIPGGGALSGDEFLVDGAAIATATNSLNGINQSLEAGLRSVVGDIEELLADGWIGQAADSFRTVYQEARTSFEQLIAEASTIMAAVPTVVDTLVDSDRTHAGDISAVQFSLDL